jgi:hypothetical protein
MEGLDVRKTVKLWAILVAASLAAVSAGTIGFVVSGQYTGRIYVQCELHNGEFYNATLLHLYVDGVKVADRPYGSFDQFNCIVWFEPIEAAAGRAHTVQVRDDIGGASELRDAHVKFRRETTVNVTMGNYSTVNIWVSAEMVNTVLAGQEVTLYIDGVEAGVQAFPTYDGGGNTVSFTRFVPRGEFHQIRATCGDLEASEDVLVDEYWEWVQLYF